MVSVSNTLNERDKTTQLHEYVPYVSNYNLPFRRFLQLSGTHKCACVVKFKFRFRFKFRTSQNKALCIGSDSLVTGPHDDWFIDGREASQRHPWPCRTDERFPPPLPLPLPVQKEYYDRELGCLF
jgi:hypothetical protein